VRQTKPQFLLLVGRTTYDYRNYQAANVDRSPARSSFDKLLAQATSDALSAI